MTEYRAAIIGCGRRGQGRGGAFGIGEAHAYAYNHHPHVSLISLMIAICWSSWVFTGLGWVRNGLVSWSMCL